MVWQVPVAAGGGDEEDREGDQELDQVQAQPHAQQGDTHHLKHALENRVISNRIERDYIYKKIIHQQGGRKNKK